MQHLSGPIPRLLLRHVDGPYHVLPPPMGIARWLWCRGHGHRGRSGLCDSPGDRGPSPGSRAVGFGESF